MFRNENVASIKLKYWFLLHVFYVCLLWVFVTFFFRSSFVFILIVRGILFFFVWFLFIFSFSHFHAHVFFISSLFKSVYISWTICVKRLFYKWFFGLKYIFFFIFDYYCFVTFCLNYVFRSLYVNAYVSECNRNLFFFFILNRLKFCVFIQNIK